MVKDVKKTDEAIEKIHNSALSDVEKEKIKAEALAEIAAEQKARIAADYKAQIKSEATRKKLFSDANVSADSDELVSVFLDLPRSAPDVKLDGVTYYPGRTYNVLPAVADVLFEVMGRTNAHEDEIRGHGTDNAYRKKKNTRV